MARNAASVAHRERKRANPAAHLAMGLEGREISHSEGLQHPAESAATPCESYARQAAAGHPGVAARAIAARNASRAIKSHHVSAWHGYARAMG